MQLYNAKVRLQDSVMNEVRKFDVTAAEIMILRSLHGAGAVVDIKPTRVDKRPHATERRRLYDIYANPERNTTEQLGEKMVQIRNIIGHDTMDLPVRLADVDPLTDAEEIKRVIVDPLA